MRNLNRILALTLAILMFFSSTGFSIDFHFCQQNLKGLSLVGSAKSCHEKAVTCPRHTVAEDDSSDNNCCSNKTIQVEDADYDYAYALDVMPSQVQLEFLNSYLLVFNELSLDISTHSASFSDQSDRLVSRDIYVLLERFLI